MPPKASARSASSGAKADEKPKKISPQQRAMDEAKAHAQKLYKQHETLRVEDEQRDKVLRDRSYFDTTIEKERLRADRAEFARLAKEFVEEERLAFLQHVKHLKWSHIPDATRLPDVGSEREVNTFLSVWRDRQREFEGYHADTIVVASGGFVAGPTAAAAATHEMRFIRGEQGMPMSKRQCLIDQELNTCLEAFELMRAIQLARDRCVAATATGSASAQAFPKNKAARESEYHCENLRKVSRQILETMDFVTVNAIMHYDVVLEGKDADKETLTRVLPEVRPTFKYGLWIKVKDVTRSFTSLLFPDIEVRLDPKSSTLPKLPKTLGLSRENVAVRALQFSFDPFAGHDPRGKEYYALDCTIRVDLVSFTHRPQTFGDWRLRTDTEAAHTLICEEYPPRSAEARIEDPAFRISFDVPQTLVIRQPSMLIGKWVATTAEWEPCSHLVFGAPLGGGGAAQAEPSARRATFVTGELAHFAILQEKTFDAPYERWAIRPVSSDQVVVSLEGRRRGDMCDRVFRILVEGAQCKLLSPDDAELLTLRSSWCEPATLFRCLTQVGFNFMLADEDAKYVSGVVPKSAALEAKAYADIAQYCQFHIIASTRHNKFGEDPDMALFRLSRSSRHIDEEFNPFDTTELPDEDWHHIRYHVSSCVLSAFTDDQERPDLNILPCTESHYNLYSTLLPVDGEDVIRTQLVNTNYLLRRCVEQILHLARPLSWG